MINITEIKFLLIHSSIYGVGTIISQAVAFLMLPLYTRYLNSRDYGILELIDTSNMLIGIVITMGIAEAMSRFYYEKSDIKYRNAVVSSTYICYLTGSAIFGPALVLISPFLARDLLGSQDYSHYFVVSFISLIFGGVGDIGLMCLRLFKKPIIYISITVSRLIILISLNIFFIVYLDYGVYGILLSSLIARGIYAVGISAGILYKTQFIFSLSIAKDIIKFALPLIPATFADTCIKQSDKYFVGLLLSLSSAGIYSLSLKLGNSIHYLITVPFLTTFIPRRFEIINMQETPKMLGNIFKQYTIFFIFIGLCLSIFIQDILQYFVSNEFRESAKYVPLIVLSLVILSCQYHFDIGIHYKKKTHLIAQINFMAAILQIVLNYTLIKYFEIWGAIISSVAAISVQASFYLYYTKKYFEINYHICEIFKALIIAIFFYIVSYYTINFEIENLNLAVRIALVLSYFPLLIFFNIITIKERIMIFESLKKLRALF